MKLAMKLRTRLFLSISALITVALLGLVLGLVSVMQMASTQEQSVRDNFILLDLGLKLRQTLGDQLMIMLDDKPDLAALEASKQQYLALIDEGLPTKGSWAMRPSASAGPRPTTLNFSRPSPRLANSRARSRASRNSRKNSTCCAMG